MSRAAAKHFDRADVKRLRAGALPAISAIAAVASAQAITRGVTIFDPRLDPAA